MIDGALGPDERALLAADRDRHGLRSDHLAPASLHRRGRGDRQRSNGVYAGPRRRDGGDRHRHGRRRCSLHVTPRCPAIAPPTPEIAVVAASSPRCTIVGAVRAPDPAVPVEQQSARLQRTPPPTSTPPPPPNAASRGDPSASTSRPATLRHGTSPRSDDLRSTTPRRPGRPARARRQRRRRQGARCISNDPTALRVRQDFVAFDPRRWRIHDPTSAFGRDVANTSVRRTSCATRFSSLLRSRAVGMRRTRSARRRSSTRDGATGHPEIEISITSCCVIDNSSSIKLINRHRLVASFPLMMDTLSTLQNRQAEPPASAVVTSDYGHARLGGQRHAGLRRSEVGSPEPGCVGVGDQDGAGSCTRAPGVVDRQPHRRYRQHRRHADTELHRRGSATCSARSRPVGENALRRFENSISAAITGARSKIRRTTAFATVRKPRRRHPRRRRTTAR